MYTEYYGFREKPFALSPDPRYLFLSETHREVLGHLIYGIEQGEGFIAITGEVGTGKTTLCRTLLQRLGSNAEVAFLFNPNLSPCELLKAINAEFGIDASAGSIPELTTVLNHFLVEKKREGRRVLIIVDEAQNLASSTLEQIRLLSNLETETSKLIQIVLIGQPELDAKLEASELRQLRQRISVWWHLGPLTASETRDYVRHRLRVAAGCDRQWFATSALSLLHRLSGGVPRVINILCDRSLLAGYGEGLREIDRRVVAEVGREVHARPGRAERKRGIPPAAWAAGGGVLVVAAFAFGLLWPSGEPSPTPAAGSAPTRAASAEQPSRSAPLALPAPAAAGPAPEANRDFASILALRAPSSAVAAAADAALSAWGLEPLRVTPLTLGEAIGALAQRGLVPLRLDAAGLVTLSQLDMPAIVALRGSDGERRWVFVRSVAGEQLTLYGVTPGAGLGVARSDFESQWSGEAYVLWRDFEGLPRVLDAGDEGPAVAWLQRALSRLGLYGAIPTARFDHTTRAAVRSFQHAQGLAADGSVGPRTKIRLYAALATYGSPTLTEGVDHARSR